VATHAFGVHRFLYLVPTPNHPKKGCMPFIFTYYRGYAPYLPLINVGTIGA